jgi:hypothetical protein
LEPVLDKAIIYRYEEIDDWGKDRLPHMNRGRFPVLEQALTEEEMDAVYEHSKLDFARFGYHRRLWVSSRAEHQLNAPAVESLSVSHEVLEKIR